MKRTLQTLLVLLVIVFSNNSYAAEIEDPFSELEGVFSEFCLWLKTIMEEDDAIDVCSKGRIKLVDRVMVVVEEYVKEGQEIQKKEAKIRPLREEIKKLKEKIKALGYTPRGEFETMEQFKHRQEQEKEYEKECENEIKKLEEKIATIDSHAAESYGYSVQEQQPIGKVKVEDIIQGRMLLTNGDITLDVFDIDDLSFTVRARKNFGFGYHQVYVDQKKKLDGEITYINPEYTEGIKLFKLKFKSPEKAKHFKEGFINGKTNLFIPVTIKFSFAYDYRNVEIDRELDAEGIISNVGVVAAGVGVVLIGAFFGASPETMSRVGEAMGENFRGFADMTHGIYERLDCFELTGRIEKFPDVYDFD